MNRSGSREIRSQMDSRRAVIAAPRGVETRRPSAKQKAARSWVLDIARERKSERGVMVRATPAGVFSWQGIGVVAKVWRKVFAKEEASEGERAAMRRGEVMGTEGKRGVRGTGEEVHGEMEGGRLSTRRRRRRRDEAELGFIVLSVCVCV